MSKIKVTKQQIEKLKTYWRTFQNLQNSFFHGMGILEKEMSNEVDIENLEFFYCDNECAGIGNTERNMRLITREELEDETKSS